MTLKPPSQDQKAKNSFLHSKSNRTTKEAKRKRGKMWGNTLLIYPIVKVQEPNIESLASFGKKESERERRKEKRRKNNNL
jgi:hypothetical protein